MRVFTFGLLLFGSLVLLSGALLALQRRNPSTAYFVLVAEGNAPRRFYTMLPDGTGQRVIYTSQYYPNPPIWKPDGKALLASWGDTPDAPGLYEINARDGQRSLLDDHALIEDNLVLSPDGQWLAYVVADGAYHRLYLTQADGTQGRVLIPDLRQYVRARSVFWSADSQWVYFAWCKSVQCSYYKVHHQSAELVMLAEGIKAQDLIFCGTSPGETWITVCDWQSQTRYLISPGQPVIEQKPMRPFFWSADEQWIYYHLEPHQLLRSRPDGTSEALALELERDCTNFFFRDDWLYCQSSETMPGLYRMRIDGTQSQSLIEGTVVGFPYLQDDGRIIVGLEDKDKQVNFYRVSPDGTESEWIIKTSPVIFYGLAPVKTHLFYTTADPHGSYRFGDYYMVDLESGKQYQLTKWIDTSIYSFSPIISLLYQNWIVIAFGTMCVLGSLLIGWRLQSS